MDLQKKEEPYRYNDNLQDKQNQSSQLGKTKGPAVCNSGKADTVEAETNGGNGGRNGDRGDKFEDYGRKTCVSEDHLEKTGNSPPEP